MKTERKKGVKRSGIFGVGTNPRVTFALIQETVHKKKRSQKLGKDL